MTTYRVKLDFVVHFTNGGSLSARDFRLDIPGNGISDDQLAAYLVQDMRLLMAGRVDITNKQIIAEPHKRVATSTEAIPSFALIVKHKTHAGKRNEVRRVWEKHMAPAVTANPGHIAYFYCFDNADPDSISAFQQYSSAEASQEFLKTDSYAAYLKEVEPLLAGPPQVTALTPVWSKDA